MADPARKDDKEAEASAPPVPISRCFAYREGLDSVCIFTACCVAFAQGTAMPFFAIVLGQGVSEMGDISSTQTFTDRMETPRNGMIAIALIGGLCGAVHNYLLSRSAERQCARLRKAYVNCLLSRDQSWFDLNNAGSLPTRIQKDVSKVQDGIGSKFGLIFVPLGQFVAGLIVGFYYSPVLSLIIMICLPLLVPSAIGMGNAMKAETNQLWYAKAGAKAEEVLSGIRTVAMFGAEERETAMYSNLLSLAMWGGVKAGAWFSVSFGWLWMVFGQSYAVAFWYAAKYMMEPDDGEPPNGGDVLMIFFAVIMGVGGVNDAAVPLQALQTGKASMASIAAVLDSKSVIESAEDFGLAGEVSELVSLEFQDVEFAYPSRPDMMVLRGCNLKVEKGQKVGFVGESGSGKSTVIQLIERFYDPAKGRVLVNGQELSKLPLNAWRQSIGYVGQEPVLFSLSVLENLQVAKPGATVEECREALRKAEALEFIEAQPKGLDTFVGSGGSQLSGGQKQRVAIARALVKQPQLLLLDEATSALDNQSEKLVQATLNKLQEMGGLTTLSIAHRLSTIKNSDVIFFLANGEVLEQGSHDQLMEKKGGYFKLVEQQAAAHIESDAGSTVASETLLKAAPVAAEKEEQAQGGSSPKKASKEAKKKEEEEKKAKEIAELKDRPRDQLNDAELEKLRLHELEESKYTPPGVGRVFKEFADGQVKALFPLGLIGCLAGAAMPVQGYLLGKIMFDFWLPYKCPDDSEDPFKALVCAVEDPPEYCCTHPKWEGIDSPLQHAVFDKAKWFCLIAVIQGIGTVLKMSVFRYIQERMVMAMRQALILALLRQEIGFFDDPKNNAAGLTMSLQKSTQTVAQICGIALGQQFESIIALLLGISLAFIADWRISTAMLLGIPLVGGAMAILVAVIMTDAGSGDGGAFGKAAAVATEALLNMRTVRALRAEKNVQDRYAAQVMTTMEVQLGNKWKEALGYGLAMAMVFLLYIIVFVAGPMFADEGWTDADDMFTAMFCIMFGAMGAGMGAMFLVDANKAKLACADLFQVIDRASSIDPVQCTGTVKEFQGSANQPFIEFKDVSFFYPHRPEVQVLKGLSFSVSMGQSVALVGPSGSGKSSCIALLQRFYDVQDGSVNVSGENLKDYDLRWWRSQLGMVGQEPLLFDASLEDNVKYGNVDATREDCEKAGKLANLDFVTNGKVQWTDSVGAGGGKLSGGQKQRVAIARALVRNPKVLLLDEATSALDSASEKIVQQALDAARAGRTTFMIAHRLTTIQDADLILVICDGVVTERGSHTELLSQQGVYWNLCQKAGQ